jgi:hypothetical protein
MKVRAIALVTVLMGVAACGPRQVEVRTTPTQATGVSIQVKNDITQPVNVYITAGGSDSFLGQVGAKESKTIPVQGFASGTTVSLKAVTIDGAKTYSRDKVVLSGTYVFPLP